MRKKGIGIITGFIAVASIAVITNVGTNDTDKIANTEQNAGIASALEGYSVESEEQKAELSALVTNIVAVPQADLEDENSLMLNVEEETTTKKETETTKAEKETTTKKATNKSTEKDNKEETTKKKTKKDKAKETKATEKTTEAATTVEAATEEETTREPSVYDFMAISQVEDYVNVRELPTTDSEVVGKMYNNCAATIVGIEGDWYKIKSGNVEGYIKAEYFLTRELAEAKALECRKVFATVTTEVLNVRAGQGTDSELVTQLLEGGVFDVVQYGDGWVYLDIDGDAYGWVSEEFVDITVKFDTAITLEEEAARIAEAERLRREAEEAERAAQEAREAEERRRAEQEAAERAAAQAEAERQEAERQQAEQQYQEEYYEPETEAPRQEQNYDTSTGEATRNAIVAYAESYVGYPYVWGGSNLETGVDCSGFTMCVYGHFGYGLSHSSSAQSNEGTEVSLDSLLPGDLLFYTNGGSGIGHVAIYAGDGQIVHASTEATGIKYSNAFYRTPVKAVRLVW